MTQFYENKLINYLTKSIHFIIFSNESVGLENVPIFCYAINHY